MKNEHCKLLPVSARLANTHPLSGILPSTEELKKMGRPRYQHPNVKKTKPKEGRARWYVRFRIDVLADRNRTSRKEQIIYLGFCDEMGKREAEKARDKKLQTVNNTPLVIQSQVVFKDLVAAYKQTFIPGLKPSTRHSYTHRIDKHIVPAFENLRLFEIDAIKVQQWVYKMEDDGLARSTRIGTLAILRSIFDCAEEWGYFSGRNPCKKTKAGAGLEVYERRALEPQQLLRFFQVCEEPLKLMLELATYTGMRASEILALTWGAIDFQHGVAVVKQSKSQQGEISTTKTPAGKREFQLDSLVKRFVRPPGAKDTDLIWPDGDYQTMQMRLKRRAEKLGIYSKGFGFHTARRSYATMRDSLRPTKPAAALVAAMGHESASMTEHYIRRSDAGIVDQLMELVNFAGITRGIVQ